jgi:hypothetical protein
VLDFFWGNTIMLLEKRDLIISNILRLSLLHLNWLRYMLINIVKYINSIILVLCHGILDFNNIFRAKSVYRNLGTSQSLSY